MEPNEDDRLQAFRRRMLCGFFDSFQESEVKDIFRQMHRPREMDVREEEVERLQEENRRLKESLRRQEAVDPQIQEVDPSEAGGQEEKVPIPEEERRQGSDESLGILDEIEEVERTGASNEVEEVVTSGVVAPARDLNLLQRYGPRRSSILRPRFGRDQQMDEASMRTAILLSSLASRGQVNPPATLPSVPSRNILIRILIPLRAPWVLERPALTDNLLTHFARARDLQYASMEKELLRIHSPPQSSGTFVLIFHKVLLSLAECMVDPGWPCSTIPGDNNRWLQHAILPAESKRTMLVFRLREGSGGHQQIKVMASLASHQDEAMFVPRAVEISGAEAFEVRNGVLEIVLSPNTHSSIRPVPSKEVRVAGRVDVAGFLGGYRQALRCLAAEPTRSSVRFICMATRRRGGSQVPFRMAVGLSVNRPLVLEDRVPALDQLPFSDLASRLYPNVIPSAFDLASN